MAESDWTFNNEHSQHKRGVGRGSGCGGRRRGPGWHN